MGGINIWLSNSDFLNRVGALLQEEMLACMAGKILDNLSETETETALVIGRFWICERTEINHVEG